MPVAVPIVLQPERPRPRMSAWARLLVYTFTAVGVGLIGNLAGSIPGILAVMAGPGRSVEPNGMTSDAVLAALPVWSVVLICYTTFLPIVAITLVFARQIDRRSWAEIGLTVGIHTRRDLVLGCLLGATVVIQMVAYVATGLVELERTEHSLLAAIGSGLILFLGVGFWEELIFRGYLLPNAEALAGRVGGIIISSLLFWLVHLTTPEARDPLTGFGLFLMGVLFSLCYYGTGSLWLGIALHASYDFLLISLFQPHSQINVPTVFASSVQAPPWLVGPPGKAGLLDMAWLGIMLAGVYFWIYRARGRGRTESH